ncbi:hypothetical protein [Pseudobacteriovorax antillogorgiicola]|uniref:Uncharacterized protein n=1 Tax=Pseudobacteriovorax antillogorgiicola TaxID=1513793 RepID=A0A1Y6BXM6_9BACT|nr:hypothetical protein [Pseudobacteriovorax antillogorgiicola]TCS43375.1 hypothetical protein EDD56_13715 [Pseudobacteriovorax antillogorgiicola]SMF35017.1 hypothetical protein SAMN06296036_110193 [Pseudobacteriovorax antillogorgiicola]
MQTKYNQLLLDKATIENRLAESDASLRSAKSEVEQKRAELRALGEKLSNPDEAKNQLKTAINENVRGEFQNLRAIDQTIKDGNFSFKVTEKDEQIRDLQKQLDAASAAEAKDEKLIFDLAGKVIVAKEEKQTLQMQLAGLQAGRFASIKKVEDDLSRLLAFEVSFPGFRVGNEIAAGDRTAIESILQNIDFLNPNQ